MKDFITYDVITDKEKVFPLPALLNLDYFKKHRHEYYWRRKEGIPPGPRNYLNLLKYLEEIYAYNPEHANAFGKAFQSSGTDRNNSEATFAEIIVYRYYIRLVHEGLITSISREHRECDIILKRLDGTKAFLEVFCIMPNFRDPEPDEVLVYDIKTHTQEEMASVRQKLLQKIHKQRQMTQPRDNYAVIELNHTSIIGDFTVLSSLSDGYKVTIDKETMEITQRGYDWTSSIFEDESTKYLKGVIYFDLGDYESRRFIANPYYD